MPSAKKENIVQRLEELLVNFEVVYKNFLKNKDKLELYGQVPITVALSEPVEEFIHYLCANLQNSGIDCPKSALIEKILVYVLSNPERLAEVLASLLPDDFQV
ncbi:hypothetical protein OCC_04305 [Thermococcus litoralis DSM 5473]|uniref:Uncharacterized protein n=1 Tax=Thermococcus litoralis (strain ATCC 51850 / DSM 5473 / JCM 8560 / NS-C) TaxID=523849 RepID=H3ZPK6_THELN|nr:hypothetical protein [Thermococcus litoralis]EHR78050.1 hypothetical protein OCC_04305 [Thermococcus litoralis DSM 5473]